MTSSFPVKLFILPGEVEYLFLSLNELGEMSQTTIEFGNFEDKNPYWLIIFENWFSLLKISSTFLTYSFDELLVFF